MIRIAKRVIYDRRSVPTATLLGLFVFWEASTRLLNIPAWLLPAPSDIFKVILSGQTIWMHTWTTLWETLAGFAMSILLGIPLGVLITQSPSLRNAIYPLLVITQSIPKVAIPPIVLVWLGYGAVTKVTIAFLVAFFPIVVNTAVGLESPSRQILDLARQLSANRLQVLTKIRFPSALPHIFSGLEVAIALSVIGAVVAEFIASTNGLGYMVLVSSAHFKTDAAFAAMLMLSVVGVVLFYLITWLRGVFVPWYGVQGVS